MYPAKLIEMAERGEVEPGSMYEELLISYINASMYIAIHWVFGEEGMKLKTNPLNKSTPEQRREHIIDCIRNKDFGIFNGYAWSWAHRMENHANRDILPEMD